MEPQKENFMDKNTILAILLLVLAWIGWDIYMKKKYPPVKPSPLTSPKEEGLKKTEEESFSLKEPSKKPEAEEKTFIVSGEKADFIISSHGLGIKKALLKNFFTREGEEIVFESSSLPLFATGFLEENTALPFQVKREGDFFKGRLLYKGTKILKTLEIEEEYILKVKIEIEEQGENFSGLVNSFQLQKKGKPEEKTEEKGFFSWYSKLMFISIPDNVGGYIHSSQGQDRLLENGTQESRSYKEVFVAALGTKYFGQAFINQSALLPEVRFQEINKGFQGNIFYKPLNKNPLSLEYKLFFGPKSLSHLSKLNSRTEQWIDFGFFGWLARSLLKMLKFFHRGFGNWGVAIILLTLFIRLCLFPMHIKSYRSMKVMQKLQPEIRKLKEKHKGDNQKFNQEMMALMKKNKASPMGGCLPMLLQLPIFYAFYRVLGESVELYQAPFMLWIKDLSFKDPFYVLPVLGGVAIFIQQKLTPTTSMSPAQARVLTFMPLIFSVFLLGLPSGLNLYIFVSTLFGLVQQYFFVKLKGEN